MSDTKHGLTFEEQWDAAKAQVTKNHKQKGMLQSDNYIDEAAEILASKIREEYEKKIKDLEEDVADSDQAVEDNYKQANENNIKLKISNREKDQEIERLKGVLNAVNDWYCDTNQGDDQIKFPSELMDEYFKTRMKDGKAFTREKVEELIKWMADNITFGDNQHYIHSLYGGKKKLFTEQILREFETGEMDSRTF